MRIKLVIFFLLGVLSAQAQPAFTVENNKALCIYNYQFTNCVAPNHLLASYNFYWAALSGIAPDKNLLAAQQIIDKSLKKTTKNSYPFVSLKLLNARILITQKKYFQALFSLNELKDFFLKTPTDTANSYNLLLWGLYHYYAAIAREQNFVYRTFLKGWPDADKNKGLQILDNLKNDTSVFVQTETYYFLSKIYLNSQHNYNEAQKTIGWLRNHYPDNTIYFELHLYWCRQQNKIKMYRTDRVNFITYLNNSGKHTPEQIKHFVAQNPQF